MENSSITACYNELIQIEHGEVRSQFKLRYVVKYGRARGWLPVLQKSWSVIGLLFAGSWLRHRDFEAIKQVMVAGKQQNPNWKHFVILK